MPTLICMRFRGCVSTHVVPLTIEPTQTADGQKGNAFNVDVMETNVKQISCSMILYILRVSHLFFESD